MRQRIERLLDWSVSHPGPTAFLLALLSTGGAALLGLVRGIPLPMVHDEFSYLLAGDTFASGRLANPAHPLWQHFETFHVLQQPTYVSKYPPAQGLFLALGQILTGRPIVGVWISVGLMTAALYWMLRAWIPRRWALLGGLLVVVQVGVASYWAQSYWGGAVAAIGGALLFGGMRRLVETPRVRDALLLGIGLAILANSRPFEGLVASLFAAGALAWFFVRRGRAFRRAFLLRAAPPILAVLAVTAVAMAGYDMATTGNPFRMPYQVYSSTYSVGSFLPWKAPRLDLEFRHAIMRQLEVEWGVERIAAMRQPANFVLHVFQSLRLSGILFFGAFALLPLLGLPAALRSRWTVFAAVAGGTVWLVALFTATFPHYLAPVAGLGYVVVLEAARRLRRLRFGRVRGSVLFAATVAAELGLFVVTLVTPGPLTAKVDPSSVAFARSRQTVIDHLRRLPGRDLVIVRYGPGHSYLQEWVYNRADIDSSQVVWAREMGPEADRQLLEHFKDRRIWMLTVTQPHAPPGAGLERLAPERAVLRPWSPPQAGDEGKMTAGRPPELIVP